MSITTRDAEARLGLPLAEAEQYADEIVVGVDVASSDGTWDVAAGGADRVFVHENGGQPSRARLAGLERATCDWILYLDDDEGMDAAFPELRDELLCMPGVTHWYLPRKWLVGTDPPEYLHAEPWWPNFALRLALADRTRVWKPPQVHSGLRVVGPHAVEPRTSILHYERMDRSEEERTQKVARYRALGQETEHRFYEAAPGACVRRVEPPPLRDRDALPRRRAAPVLQPEVEDLRSRWHFPPWGAEVSVDMPATARAGDALIVAARARNTGTLRWSPTASCQWPDLSLSYHLYDAAGERLPDDSERARVGRDVAPGEWHDFLPIVRVPQVPGDYLLAWQMLSDGEYWFDEFGCPTADCRLTVTPA